MTTTLGVCYYPEHWPAEQWRQDAAAMREHGISQVRIGEFAWSRIEPAAGRYDWEWLDQAIDVLAEAGLNIVLGTPTACPPHWLIKAHPEILPVGEDGRVRGFGSRRHYRFSSRIYREHSRRITTALAERYGKRRDIVGWQLDNEYGCHDTTLDYSDEALSAFHGWLAERYGRIEALNEAWGNVFWSQEYAAFEDVGLPVAVTETNPAHRLAFQRFSSDQVKSFNDEQAAILRTLCHDAVWLTHNFMGNFSDFDHYRVMQTLDVASWDSYPLGFLDQGGFEEQDKQRYRRSGHPDWAAFHHDLYRGVGRGRFGVMEQQPGAVNWAPSNAEPRDGMVRLWSMEAIAHGAEFVSWFRWRQAPFAQEQMHAGILRADGQPAQASFEVKQLNEELALLPDTDTTNAKVAILFDYEACWATQIQPNNADFKALDATFCYYAAARSLGLNVDILPLDATLSGYKLILLPCVPFADEALAERLGASGALIVLGARAGSRTREFRLPDTLPPGALRRLIDVTVTSTDSVRPGVSYPIVQAPSLLARRWIDHVESSLEPRWEIEDGRGVAYQQDQTCYIAACINHSAMRTVIDARCLAAGIETTRLADGLRIRRRGELAFVFNYSDNYLASPLQGERLLGNDTIAPGDFSVYRSTG